MGNELAVVVVLLIKIDVYKFNSKTHLKYYKKGKKGNKERCLMYSFFSTLSTNKLTVCQR